MRVNNPRVRRLVSVGAGLGVVALDVVGQRLRAVGDKISEWQMQLAEIAFEYDTQR